MGTRLQNVDWRPGDDNSQAPTWERVAIAVLLDLRDELQRLNSLLQCDNFIAIPKTLRSIDKKLTTKKR